MKKASKDKEILY